MYCTECGVKLEPSNPEIVWYNQKTGVPMRKVFFKCVKSRWWNYHTDDWEYLHEEN